MAVCAEGGKQAEEGELAAETTPPPPDSHPKHVQQHGGDMTASQLFPYVPEQSTQGGSEVAAQAPTQCADNQFALLPATEHVAEPEVQPTVTTTTPPHPPIPPPPPSEKTAVATHATQTAALVAAGFKIAVTKRKQKQDKAASQ